MDGVDRSARARRDRLPAPALKSETASTFFGHQTHWGEVVARPAKSAQVRPFGGGFGQIWARSADAGPMSDDVGPGSAQCGRSRLISARVRPIVWLGFGPNSGPRVDQISATLARIRPCFGAIFATLPASSAELVPTSAEVRTHFAWGKVRGPLASARVRPDLGDSRVEPATLEGVQRRQMSAQVGIRPNIGGLVQGLPGEGGSHISVTAAGLVRPDLHARGSGQRLLRWICMPAPSRRVKSRIQPRSQYCTPLPGNSNLSQSPGARSDGGLADAGGGGGARGPI